MTEMILPNYGDNEASVAISGSSRGEHISAESLLKLRIFAVRAAAKSMGVISHRRQKAEPEIVKEHNGWLLAARLVDKINPDQQDITTEALTTYND